MPELRTVAACTVSGRIHPYRVRLRPISAHGRDRHVPLSYTAGVVVLATVHGREAFLLELYTVTAMPQRVYTVGIRPCRNCARWRRVHFRNERIPRVRLRPISAHGRDRHVPFSYTAGVVVLATVHGGERLAPELYTVTGLPPGLYTVGTRPCRNCTRWRSRSSDCAQCGIVVDRLFWNRTGRTICP